MRKQKSLWFAVLCASILSGCATSSTRSSASYDDYVYSVDYSTNPYWTNRYYPRYQWSNNYWFGNRPMYGGSYGTGIYGRSW